MGKLVNDPNEPRLDEVRLLPLRLSRSGVCSSRRYRLRTCSTIRLAADASYSLIRLAAHLSTSMVPLVSALFAWMSPSTRDESPPDESLPVSSFLSWIPTPLHPLLRTLLIHALRLAPRPKHVAFIMDGNRRSARLRSLPVRVGHEEGFDALKRVLSFLLKLEIPHVTVYAFSIENFNRDPQEVDTLMGMARERLIEICRHG